MTTSKKLVPLTQPIHITVDNAADFPSGGGEAKLALLLFESNLVYFLKGLISHGSSDADGMFGIIVATTNIMSGPGSDEKTYTRLLISSEDPSGEEFTTSVPTGRDLYIIVLCPTGGVIQRDDFNTSLYNANGGEPLQEVPYEYIPYYDDVALSFGPFSISENFEGTAALRTDSK